MKKLGVLILVGTVLLGAVPLWGKIVTWTDKDGNSYSIVQPDVIRLTITLPEITELSIAEIEVLSPDVKYATIQKLSVSELNIVEPRKLVYLFTSLSISQLQTISPAKSVLVLTKPSQSQIRIIQPEKVAILITKLERKDLDIVLKKLAPRSFWYSKQVEYYNAWKKKDVKTLTKLIQKAREVSFFTCWGNYQNFEDVNFSKIEPQFNYRQILISEMDYNWREKFKPAGDIVLTINYGLGSMEIKALLELISENKDKIKLIVLPWGAFEMNNYDNRDVSTYLEVAEWADRLFYSIKEIAPEIPIYLTVCVVHETMDKWIKSFNAEYDGIALWNITNINKAPLQKVYNLISKYNKNVILSGIFQCNPDKNWLSWDIAKQSITQEDLKKAKDIGFKGVIFMTNEKD